jgi:glycosyltransferase involved in cell wall biosynthesis
LEQLDGMKVHRVGRRLSFAVRGPLYFRKAWGEGSFDVIVEDLNKVPVFLPLLTRTPVVLLVHHLFGITAFQEAALPLAAATWLLERPLPWVYASGTTVAVSPSTAVDLGRRGLSASEIEIVHNGVDLDRFSPDPGVPRFPSPTALYLGRLKRYKRVDLILRAVARLRKGGIRTSLLVAGKGDDESRLRTLSRRLGLGESVSFLGFVDEEEKINLFRRAWVHVLTSPKEGWGISALEAAACGTPTLASDSPGLRDVVRDGETGVLVPHADVRALARGLRSFVENPRQGEEMGGEARRFAERFTWDDSARRMSRVLEGRVAPMTPGN